MYTYIHIYIYTRVCVYISKYKLLSLDNVTHTILPYFQGWMLDIGLLIGVLIPGEGSLQPWNSLVVCCSFKQKRESEKLLEHTPCSQLWHTLSILEWMRELTFLSGQRTYGNLKDSVYLNLHYFCSFHPFSLIMFSGSPSFKIYGAHCSYLWPQQHLNMCTCDKSYVFHVSTTKSFIMLWLTEYN